MLDLISSQYFTKTRVDTCNMIIEKLQQLGYDFAPGDVAFSYKGATMHSAVRVGNLVFTGGSVSVYKGKELRGLVGKDIDVETAALGAEYCAYNCLLAVGKVADIEKIKRVVKMFGMVNVAEGFNETSEVVNGASLFLEKVLGDKSYSARTAVGMVLPSNWAVEIDMVFEIE